MIFHSGVYPIGNTKTTRGIYLACKGDKLIIERDTKDGRPLIWLNIVRPALLPDVLETPG